MNKWKSVYRKIIPCILALCIALPANIATVYASEGVEDTAEPPVISEDMESPITSEGWTYNPDTHEMFISDLTNLHRDEFPEDVRYIIIFSNGNNKVIPEEAFRGCENLLDVEIPGSVETIEDCAFMGCKSLNGLTIPEGVRKIGEDVFVGCGEGFYINGYESYGEDFSEAKKYAEKYGYDFSEIGWHTWGEAYGKENDPYEYYTCQVCGKTIYGQVLPPGDNQGSATLLSTNKRKSQSIKVSTKNKIISYKKLSKKKRSFRISATSKTNRTFKKIKGNKKITVASNGKVTLKRRLKKGKYKIVVLVTAVPTLQYAKATKKVTITIRVK